MIENDPQWKWPDQWTPAHHWYMRAEEISYTRHRQQARLAFWRDRQRQSCEWICLADIADWCAMGSTSLARDEERRIQASADLLQAVRRGEFNRRGRLCVAYIPPWHFVCPDPIRFRLDVSLIRWPVPVEFLAYLWAPRDLCAQWFAARPNTTPMPGLTVTPEASPAACLAAPAAAKAGVVAQPSQPAYQKPNPSNPAVRRWMRDRVASWPDDKIAPPEDVDLCAAQNHFAPGLTRDDFRLVREAETPSEWRKQGRRRPWGQVKKPRGKE